MNPAERLLSIYDKLIGVNADRPMVQAWAEIFSLDAKAADLEDDATSCIVALRQQIDFVRMRLGENEVPSELLSPAFDRLKNVASPGQLHSSWNGHKGNLQAPECRCVFKWAAWVLRNEREDDLPEEEATALHIQIESLEKSLKETEMSPYLRDFIQRQVDTIRAALRVYSIRGVRPLQDALQKVAGTYLTERALLEAEHVTTPEAAKGVVVKVLKSLKKLQKFATVWVRSRNLAEKLCQLRPQSGRFCYLMSTH